MYRVQKGSIQIVKCTLLNKTYVKMSKYQTVQLYFSVLIFHMYKYTIVLMNKYTYIKLFIYVPIWDF